MGQVLSPTGLAGKQRKAMAVLSDVKSDSLCRCWSTLVCATGLHACPMSTEPFLTSPTTLSSQLSGTLDMPSASPVAA